MPVHPTILAMLQAAKQAGIPGPSAGTPADARARLAKLRETLGAKAPIGRCETIEIATRAGAIRGLCVAPDGPSAGLVVYLHGGGWVVGTLEDFEVLARRLCAASGCTLVLPEYRLAPEHPFPAALQDAEDAILWADRQRPLLAGPNSRLVVAGDSAGGNLAAVLARTLQGRASIAGQVLIYPVTDHDMDTWSYRSFAQGYPLTRHDMAWFLDHYAPAALRDLPDISPLRAKSLAGLPPAAFVLAEYDVLRSEGEAYAARLTAAGVPVEVVVYPGMTHGFIRLHNRVDVADRAAAAVGRTMRSMCS